MKQKLREGIPELVGALSDEETQLLHKRHQGSLSLQGSFSRKKPKDQLIIAAKRRIKAYEAELRLAESLSSVERARVALLRLAENHLVLGEFSEAYHYALDLKERFRDESALARVDEVWNAINKPDGEFCQCPPKEVDNMNLPVHFQEGEFLSPKTGEWTPRIRCGVCGSLNITGFTPPAFQDPEALHSNRRSRNPKTERQLFKK